MNHRVRTTGLAGTAIALATCGVVGCAHQAPQEQTIEVRVETDSPAWAIPLACQASNSSGTWSFEAPGSVTVLQSTVPLQIACQVPAGAVAEPSITSPSAASARERSREGASTGAKVGAGAGVALGAAAAPVMGGPFAILIAAGAVIRGGEIGGLVGALRSGEKHHYPSSVVLHIKSGAPSGPSQ